MANRLKRKFVLVTMLSVSIVLILILTAINLTNYIRILNQEDSTLKFLLGNGGGFPNNFMEYFDSFDGEIRGPDDLPFRDQPRDIGTPQGDFERERRGGMMSVETPFETRFFSVTFASDGSVIGSDTSSIVAVTEAQARSLAAEVIAKGSTSGWSGNYRYISDGSLVIFLDCTKDLRAVRSFLLYSLAASTAGLLLVFGISVFLAGLIVKPIDESNEKQRRFITDASHEIRTPLTIIDANTEVLEMTGGENDWTRSTRNQIKRLSELTASLVALSRMDEVSPTTEAVDFSLSDAVGETISGFESMAITSGRTLETDIRPGIQLHGDEQKIRQLCSILMDNAMKCTSAGGWIRASLDRTGKKAVLSVSNSVDSMEKGPHDEVFDRFTRIDRSRSSEIPGYGLGLSLARSIVNLHHGRIQACSEDGKSFTVTAVL